MSSYLRQRAKLKLKIMLGKALATLVAVGVATYFLFCLLAPIIQFDTVIYRYPPDNSSTLYVLKEAKILNATGQLTDPSTAALDTTNLSNAYGQWREFSTYFPAGAQLQINLTGQVSLCQAYIPSYNLEQTGANDNTGHPVPIPRVEDTSTIGIPLILNATTGEWRNVANVFKGDNLRVVMHGNNESASVSQFDRMNNTTITANCSPNQSSYSPICGRHTIWGSYVNNYTSGTWTINEQTGSHSVCDYNDLGTGLCLSHSTVADYNNVPHCCTCTPSIINHPRTYISATDVTTIGLFTNLSDIDGSNKNYPSRSQVTTNPYHGIWGGNAQWDTHSNSGGPTYGTDSAPCQNIINNAVYDRDQTFWWYINGTGLLSRYDNTSNGTPTNISTLGSNFTLLHPNLVDSATQKTFAGPYNFATDRVIYDGQYPNEGYYQLRIYDCDGCYADNNGGYVIYVKQTKCLNINGQVTGDSIMSDRGTVQLYWSHNSVSNPNVSLDQTQITNLSFSNGIANYTVPSDGNLWLKIKNVTSDYPNSYGTYNVSLFAQEPAQIAGLFQTKIMGPLISSIKNFILSKSSTVFQNMVCYQNNDKSKCTSFFLYLQGVLTLYIMSYGLMFLLGAVEINHQDLVIRLVKISIVAGLMNDKTFGAFNTWILPLISGSTDQIIANLAGFPQGSNIFLFADPIMSEILFSDRFYAKLFALTGVGSHGILFFIITIVSTGAFIMAIFKAMAIYFMAFCAEALLISVAPIFLSFMLFETTKYLFDSWAKLLLKYIFEPIIIIGGIIILTQMFTVVVDYAMPYSVVIKCAIRIYSPLSFIAQYIPIPGVEALGSIPIMCLNGFVPWGFDTKDGGQTIGLRMDYFVVMMILSFVMYHYIPFGTQIASSLLGSSGPSSATPANQMTSDARNAALKPMGMDDQSRAKRKFLAKSRREKIEKERKADIRKAFVEGRYDPNSKKPLSNGQKGSELRNKINSISKDQSTKLKGISEKLSSKIQDHFKPKQ